MALTSNVTVRVQAQPFSDQPNDELDFDEMIRGAFRRIEEEGRRDIVRTTVDLTNGEAFMGDIHRALAIAKTMSWWPEFITGMSRQIERTSGHEVLAAFTNQSATSERGRVYRKVRP